jgi:hypothetical protein
LEVRKHVIRLVYLVVRMRGWKFFFPIFAFHTFPTRLKIHIFFNSVC